MKYILVLLAMLMVPLAAQSIEYQWVNEKGEQVQLSSLKGKPVVTFLGKLVSYMSK